MVSRTCQLASLSVGASSVRCGEAQVVRGKEEWNGERELKWCGKHDVLSVYRSWKISLLSLKKHTVKAMSRLSEASVPDDEVSAGASGREITEMNGKVCGTGWRERERGEEGGVSGNVKLLDAHL